MRALLLVVASLAAGLVLAGVAAMAAPAARAADPSADPRCGDREQHGAPPGIDLRVVCAADRVIGTYAGDEGAHADLLPLAGVALLAGTGIAVLAALALRPIRARAARRLAPAAPGAWWVCDGCRSVNAAGRTACYACRAPAPATATEPAALMPTAAAFESDQRFGRPG